MVDLLAEIGKTSPFMRYFRSPIEVFQVCDQGPNLNFNAWQAIDFSSKALRDAQEKSICLFRPHLKVTIVLQAPLL